MFQRNIFKVIDNAYGHKRSLKTKESVDQHGNPIPWITYPALFFLNQLELEEKIVFEWGMGNSTLFFANKAKEITSIENKSKWFNRINAHKKDNMILYLIDLDNYADAINKGKDKKYDIIVIDGELNERFNCAKNAINHLAQGGMIILDNSDWLKNTTKFLRGNNLIQVDMAGIGPINDYHWCTSLFLNRSYNFKSKDEKQPAYVPGGLTKIRD